MKIIILKCEGKFLEFKQYTLLLLLLFEPGFQYVLFLFMCVCLYEFMCIVCMQELLEARRRNQAPSDTPELEFQEIVNCTWSSTRTGSILYCWAISSAHEFSLNKFILVIYFYHSKSVFDPFPLGNNPKHSRETRRWKCKCQFQQNQKRANIWILQNRQEELSEAVIQHRVAGPWLRSQKMGLSARQDGKRDVRGLRYQQMLTCCKCGLPTRSKVTSLFTVVGPEVSLTRFDSKPMWNTKWSCTQVSHLFRKLWSQRPLSGVFYTYPKGTI